MLSRFQKPGFIQVLARVKIGLTRVGFQPRFETWVPGRVYLSTRSGTRVNSASSEKPFLYKTPPNSVNCAALFLTFCAFSRSSGNSPSLRNFVMPIAHLSCAKETTDTLALITRTSTVLIMVCLGNGSSSYPEAAFANRFAY